MALEVLCENHGFLKTLHNEFAHVLCWRGDVNVCKGRMQRIRQAIRFTDFPELIHPRSIKRMPTIVNQLRILHFYLLQPFAEAGEGFAQAVQHGQADVYLSHSCNLIQLRGKLGFFPILLLSFEEEI
jgi:hypothetical protein